MNRTQESVQQQVQAKQSVLGFFSKFLSPVKKEILAGNSLETSLGISEPSLPESTLKSVTEYLKEKNSVLQSQFNASSTSISNFAPIFESKRQKINTWRAMYQYPEINRATHIVLNEALARDDNGDIVKLNFHQVGDSEIPMAVQEIMNTAFSTLVFDIYDVEKNIHAMFRKFLIEGEIYIELLFDDKTKNITGFNILPSYSMAPIYKDNTTTLIGFTQYEDIVFNQYAGGQEPEYDSVMGVNHKVFLGNDNYGVNNLSVGPIEFLSNQIAYANMGSYSSSEYNIDGYYSSIRKVYNMLSTVDDALAIYRFVRAPETRVWNIYTGNLPPPKVNNHLENVITEFRKDFNYNPSTGEINQDTVFNSIIDDYFFASDGNGNKTTVEPLSGAMNLDQLSDIQYYQEKLYTGLKIPKYMWDPTVEVSVNSTRDSVRSDEMELTYFIESLQNNFVSIFEGPFELLCRILGVQEKYLSKKYYSITFARRNSWKFWQDKAKFSAQIEMYTAAKELIWHPEDNKQGPFAPKFVLERCFDFSANEWQVNADMLAEYQASFNQEKTKAETWESTPPEKTDEYVYGHDFTYGNVIRDEDVFEYGSNNFTYGTPEVAPINEVPYTAPTFEHEVINRPQFDYGSDYTYGTEDEEAADNYWYNNAYQYGNEENIASNPVTDSINEFATDPVDQELEVQQYIYNQAYLYGIESEAVKAALQTNSDVLDDFKFIDSEDIIKDDDFITAYDKFMFGSAYTYGSNPEELLCKDDESEDSDESGFSYGKDFQYGDK